MSGSQEGDSPGRRPAGARPIPKKRSHGMFLRRHEPKSSEDAPTFPLSVADVQALGGKGSELRDAAILVPTAETPITPAPLVESPLTSPRMMATTQGNSSGRNSPTPFVLSPKPVMMASPMSMAPERPLPEQVSSPGKAFRTLQLGMARARAASPGPSSSASTQWSALRQAVKNGQISRLASPAPSDRSFPIRRIGSPAPSDRSFAPPRPKVAIPKRSRLGTRFGSRDLPQPVRGAEAQEARRFEADVREACWASRYARNGHARQKWSVDNGAESGNYFNAPSFSASSMHLPFVSGSASASNVSLPLSGTETPTTGLAGRRKATVQPQSPTTATTPTAVHLQPLFDVISRYTQIAYQAPGLTWLSRLPAENEVLAVLAMPFVALYQGSALEEQRIALDCFDIMLRTWPAQEFEDVLDRLIWCCEAASRAQGALMNRLLTMIRTMTVPSGSPQPVPPTALKACFHALFSLQIARSQQHDLSSLVSNILLGKWIVADAETFEEEFAPAKFAQTDSSAVLPFIGAEVLARMLDTEDRARRQHCIALLQANWPLPSSSYTDMQAKVHAQAAVFFCMFAGTAQRRDSKQYQQSSPTVSLFNDRILPFLRQQGWQPPNLCSAVAAYLLGLLFTCEETAQIAVLDLTQELWRSGETGREALLTELRREIPKLDHGGLLTLYGSFARSSHDWSELMSRIIPLLFEHLVATLPEPNPSLAALTTMLGQKYPQHFYKPLFTCAASVKDDVIAAQLSILTAVSRVTPNFWVSNSEMITVALLGDVGSGVGKGKGKEGSGMKWGRTRPGQCVVTLEVIHELRRICGDLPGIRGDDRPSAHVTRFSVELENRMAILIDAKEQAVLLPFSQRILLATVLLYLRKVNRSLKSAAWMSRLMAWCCESYDGAIAHSATPTPAEAADRVDSSAISVVVTQDTLAEVETTFARINEMYTASKSSGKSTKGARSMSLLSPIVPTSDRSVVERTTDKNHWDTLTSSKVATLEGISTHPAVASLSLLVAVNGLLQQEDYALLGRVIWNRYLDNNDHALILASAFLFMQFAERLPEEATTLIRTDLLSRDENLTRRALRRLSHLISRRNQILSQFHITDRNHRRPFKGIRPPISFVATDIGSSNFVASAEEDDSFDVTGGVAREVKKKLLEIGWVEDENEDSDEAAAERTSLALLPSTLLNRLGSMAGSHATSSIEKGAGESNDPQRPLLRRKSSGSNYYVGVKRRIVFVSSVSASLQYLGAVASDTNPWISGFAQEIISSAVRDDVALVGRPTMEILSGQGPGVESAIRNLRLLFFAQSAVPHSVAHHLFNHLVGFLKALSRDTRRLDSYHLLATTLPVLARIATHVPDVSLRDLRRNKVEVILLPTGSLWFPANSPPGPMFPRSLPVFSEKIDSVPLDELEMLSIRATQNLFVLQLLVKEPKDVYTFEKTALPVLPSTSGTAGSPDRRSSRPMGTSWSAWTTLGATYLLVARQLFRSLSTNLNDRAKLSNMLEGVNATLLAFPGDLGIVTHSMLAYGTAIMRFRRLVANTNGFSLLIPTIWLVYKERNSHSSVRIAVQHAFKFFHAVHGETFVFQAIDCLASVLGAEANETENSGPILYGLFKCLDMSSAKSGDIAGLQDAFASILDPPISSSAEKSNRSKGSGRSTENVPPKIPIALPSKRTNDGFPMENLIRLCLTIIAHDPASARAPRFLRVLRVLSRKLYQHSPSARDLLRDGVDALGGILAKNLATRLGLVEVNALHPDVEKPILPSAAETSQLLAFRREYLHLLTEYTSAGGVPTATSTGRTLALLRTILKDSSHAYPGELADFLGHYAAACLKPGLLSSRDVRSILKDFSQLFQMYGDTVDCSRVLKVVETLLSSNTTTSDPAFADLVVGEWCRPALLICEAAASEHRLWDLPLRKAVVSLMCAVIANGNLELFTLLEVRQPTPSLLGGLLLPLAVSMPTTRDQAHSRAVHQEQRCAQWLRIVSYVLAACRLLKSAPTTNIRRRLRKASPSRGEDRTSHHSRENTRQRLASAVFAFQILKIVLLRASEDLQDAPTRVWTFIGAGLRDLLEEGNADFLIRANEGSPSPSPSRPVTPGEAAHTSDNVLLRPNDGQRSPVSPMGESHPSQSRPPRAIDYLLWTILELVTSHATPLMHQMRVFVQEKIKQTNQVISRIDHRMSRSPKRASVFLRPKLNGSPDLNASPQPRQSMLKWSPTSTPSPSPSKVMTNSYFSVEATTPSPLRTHGTRIVHLGPVNLPANSEEQGGTGIGAHRLSSDSLATATVRAMQAVRLTMGYATLEVPTDRYNTLQINFIPWTRASALARVIEETSVFIDWEFRSELLAQAPLRSDSFSHPAHSPINQEK